MPPKGVSEWRYGPLSMNAQVYLFVPGDSETKLAKAASLGADAIIADLEDAVAPAIKPEARLRVAAWLADRGSLGVERWVRVNAGEHLQADVAALEGTAPTGIMVPKVHGPGDLDRATAALDAAGLTSAGLLPLIETAEAVVAVDAIARVPRVRRLMIGEMDLGVDLGMAPGIAAWDAIRVRLVVASAAVGLPAPIGPVDADFHDLARLDRETRRLFEMGFRARAAIHPAQIPVLLHSLAPTPEEIAWARRVIATYAEALDGGRGAVVDIDGSMIDEAVVARARRIVAARDADARDPGAER